MPVFKRNTTHRGERPGPDTLRQMLGRSGISLDGQALDRLWRFHQMLRENNEDRDLTRIINFEAVVHKHYVDCLIIAQLTQLPSPLLDIGTGAGFPGIPLKIFRPHVEMVLAEHRPRRVEFLKKVIHELGLKGITVFDHKVVSESFQKPVQGVITRALEPMDKTFLRTMASLEKHGKLIFMKGPHVGEELQTLKKRFSGQYNLLENRAYTLPHTPHERKIIILEKLIDRQSRPVKVPIHFSAGKVAGTLSLPQ